MTAVLALSSTSAFVPNAHAQENGDQNVHINNTILLLFFNNISKIKNYGDISYFLIFWLKQFEKR